MHSFDPHAHARVLTVTVPQEEEFLRTRVPQADISSLDKSYVASVSKHMRMIMERHRGVGLSANQIGLSLRMFVCQLPSRNGSGYEGKFYTLLNPEFTTLSEKKISDQEGCLSIPRVYGTIPRSAKLTVTGYDKNLRLVNHTVEGYLARIMQHEMDHLNGILFTDTAQDIMTIDHE